MSVKSKIAAYEPSPALARSLHPHGTAHIGTITFRRHSLDAAHDERGRPKTRLFSSNPGTFQCFETVVESTRLVSATVTYDSRASNTTTLQCCVKHGKPLLTVRLCPIKVFFYSARSSDRM